MGLHTRHPLARVSAGRPQRPRCGVTVDNGWCDDSHAWSVAECGVEFAIYKKFDIIPSSKMFEG
jgi:hypothetical protein